MKKNMIKHLERITKFCNLAVRKKTLTNKNLQNGKIRKKVTRSKSSIKKQNNICK